MTLFWSSRHWSSNGKSIVNYITGAWGKLTYYYSPNIKKNKQGHKGTAVCRTMHCCKIYQPHSTTCAAVACGSGTSCLGQECHRWKSGNRKSPFYSDVSIWFSGRWDPNTAPAVKSGSLFATPQIKISWQHGPQLRHLDKGNKTSKSVESKRIPFVATCIDELLSGPRNPLAMCRGSPNLSTSVSAVHSLSDSDSWHRSSSTVHKVNANAGGSRKNGRVTLMQHGRRVLPLAIRHPEWKYSTHSFERTINIHH